MKHLSQAIRHLKANPMTRMEAILWLKQNGFGLSDTSKALRAVYPAPVRGD